MNTKMKTKWAVLAGSVAIMGFVATGCFETEGGSSSNDGPGSTNRPVVVQICFGVPVCSTTGQGTLNGAVFNGGAGYVYVSPGCSSSSASMYVRIKVLASASAQEIDYYEWTIRNWTGAAPDGIFTADTYDSLLDTNGVFKVRTSANQIRYMSTANSNLLALASVVNQVVDVTVMTKEGKMATGAISLKLHSGKIDGAQLVYSGLRSTDSFSNYRPSNFADYYTFTNTGTTNVLSMEGDFATTLVLYNTNLTAVATNEGLFSGSFISQIAGVLSNGTSYIVEATSANDQGTGNYSIFNTTGQLAPIPSPFVSGGSCSSIAGNYTVTETLVVNLTFGGQSYVFTNLSSSPVTITQSGCNFMYPVKDPTGLIPPTLLMGRVDFTDLTLYSEAIMPECPEFFFSSSFVTGTGTSFSSGLSIDSAGTLSGTFLGLPFTVTYTSKSGFSK